MKNSATTPVSATGRFLVMVYAVIGLPLALFTLFNQGRFFYFLLFRLMGKVVSG
jgi:hypothetical protein